MAKISLFLDTRYERNGKYPLKISVAHNRTTAYYPVGISLTPDAWQSPSKYTDGFVKKIHPEYRLYNNRIQELISVFEQKIRELESRGKLYSFSSAKDLRNYISSSIEGRDSMTFLRFFSNQIESRSNEGTKRLFQETYRRILEYTKGIDILFDQINVRWLEGFSRFMGGSANYQSIHLRNIRTVYNQAIKTDIVPLSSYPFRKFKIKKEATKKRSLTIDQLSDIVNMDIPSYQERYRDLFMLSFYLIGINMVDLLHLKPGNINNDRLVYRRCKTKKIYDIKLEKEALSIIDKYRGKEYLLNFLEKSKYDNIFRRMNRQLKTLGAEEIINNKGKKQKSNKYSFLSSYYTRHTWATIAAYLDIPKETIAAALGHEMGNTTTAIYINFDQRKIDDANRAVIDFLNETRKRKTV